LPTEKYKSVFEFLEVIIENTVSFFHLGYSKKPFPMTSQSHHHTVIIL